MPLLRAFLAHLLTLQALATAWAAHLYEGGGIGHFVVVDGVDAAGNVLIRDPWAGGSQYAMEMSEFSHVWNGEAVFK